MRAVASIAAIHGKYVQRRAPAWVPARAGGRLTEAWLEPHCASFTYQSGFTKILQGSIDLDTDTFRGRLVMNLTTCDTQNDGMDFPSNFTTLDTCDSTGYADVALTTPTVTENDTNNRADWDAASDLVFSGLGGDASRTIVGCLIFKFVTNDTDSPIICYIEFSSAIAAAATQVTVPISTTNIIQCSMVSAP